MSEKEVLKLALEALIDLGANDYEGFGDVLDALEEALAQPEQEPVCEKDPQGCWNVRCQLGKKCKNTPLQRKPLTDEEYEALVEDLGDWSRYVEVDTAHQTLTKHVRQVLAAHGIKENT